MPPPTEEDLVGNPNVKYRIARFVSRTDAGEIRVRWAGYPATCDTMMTEDQLKEPNGTMTSTAIKAELEKMRSLHSRNPELAAVDSRLPPVASVADSAVHAVKSTGPAWVYVPYTTGGSDWKWECRCTSKFVCRGGKPSGRARAHVVGKHASDAELLLHLRTGPPSIPTVAANVSEAGDVEPATSWNINGVTLIDLATLIEEHAMCRREGYIGYRNVSMKYACGYFASLRKYNYLVLSMQEVERELEQSDRGRAFAAVHRLLVLNESWVDLDDAIEAFNKENKQLAAKTVRGLMESSLSAPHLMAKRRSVERLSDRSQYAKSSGLSARHDLLWAVKRAMVFSGQLGARKSSGVDPAHVRDAVLVSAKGAVLSCLAGSTVERLSDGMVGVVACVEADKSGSICATVEYEPSGGGASVVEVVPVAGWGLRTAAQVAQPQIAGIRTAVGAVVDADNVAGELADAIRQSANGANGTLGAGAPPQPTVGCASHIDFDALDKVPEHPTHKVVQVFDQSDFGRRVRMALTASLPPEAGGAAGGEDHDDAGQLHLLSEPQRQAATKARDGKGPGARKVPLAVKPFPTKSLFRCWANGARLIEEGQAHVGRSAKIQHQYDVEDQFVRIARSVFRLDEHGKVPAATCGGDDASPGTGRPASAAPSGASQVSHLRSSLCALIFELVR